MNDIKNKENIRTLVYAFYDDVRMDPTIGPVFHARIKKDEWPAHLEKLTSFWNTVLFAQGDYRGNPFSKHQSLPIESFHFNQWIHLFQKTLDRLFSGPKTEEAKLRAQKMSLMFQSKLAHLRKNTQYKSII